MSLSEYPLNANLEYPRSQNREAPTINEKRGAESRLLKIETV